MRDETTLVCSMREQSLGTYPSVDGVHGVPPIPIPGLIRARRNASGYGSWSSQRYRFRQRPILHPWRRRSSHVQWRSPPSSPSSAHATILWWSQQHRQRRRGADPHVPLHGPAVRVVLAPRWHAAAVPAVPAGSAQAATHSWGHGTGARFSPSEGRYGPGGTQRENRGGPRSGAACEVPRRRDGLVCFQRIFLQYRA